MAALEWLELRGSRPYLLLTFVGLVLGVAAWIRLVGTDTAVSTAATAYAVVHVLVLMIGCLMTSLLTVARPPRFLILLPLVEVPALLLCCLGAIMLDRFPADRWPLILLVVPATQVAVFLGGALAQLVLVPVLRRLAASLGRRRQISERQATVDVLLLGTVTGGVLLVVGTMLAGMAPQGTGTRAGLLRAAVSALLDFSPADRSVGRQAWAWAGRIGLAVVVLAGAPLAFTRRR